MQKIQETRVQSLGWEDPLDKEKATHASILAWEIPWTKDPGGPQSRGSQGNWTRLNTYADILILQNGPYKSLLNIHHQT